VFCPQCIYVFEWISEQTAIMYLYKINYRFYNRGRECLLSGTNWDSKSDGHGYVLIGLMCTYIAVLCSITILISLSYIRYECHFQDCNCTVVNSGGRTVLGVGLRQFGCWQCEFESCQWYRCSLVHVVRFRRADTSYREVLPNMCMCLSVCLSVCLYQWVRNNSIQQLKCVGNRGRNKKYRKRERKKNPIVTK